MTQPARKGWWVTFWIQLRHFGAYRIAVVEKRTFTDVIFKSSNLANLTNPRRYGNGTSALGVLYLFVTEQSGRHLCIICHDVGWLRCLSLGGGNARA